MNINIIIKSVAKTRNLNAVSYTIADNTHTAKDLITALVHCEINRYENHTLRALSQQELDEMVENGKVSFGFKYRAQGEIDRKEAVKVALEAFDDGLFVLFVGKIKYTSQNDVLNLKGGENISLIRLTMLTGRYF